MNKQERRAHKIVVAVYNVLYNNGLGDELDKILIEKPRAHERMIRKSEDEVLDILLGEEYD